MEMTIGSRIAQAPAVTPGAGASLEGFGAGETNGFGEEVLRIVRSAGKDGWQVKLATLKQFSEMIDSHFKALSTIAKNMGVSEEERAAAEQRLKDLEKKRDELERRKKENQADEAWEDILELLKQMVDPSDRELLESRMVLKG